jgi:hypothetical protein
MAIGIADDEYSTDYGIVPYPNRTLSLNHYPNVPVTVLGKDSKYGKDRVWNVL